MALFYLLAKRNALDFEWGYVNSKIDTIKRKCVTVFPISNLIGLSTNAIGITASVKFEDQINVVIEELTQIFEVLWQAEFEVHDLWKGQIITRATFREVMNYL